MISALMKHDGRISIIKFQEIGLEMYIKDICKIFVARLFHCSIIKILINELLCSKWQEMPVKVFSISSEGV